MPKIVDHDARRSEVIEAFFRVVLRTGIEGATTRAIAREAGLSLGAVWHYFADRDALVLSAFERLNDGFAARLRTAASAEASPADALSAVCLQALPLDAHRRVECGVWLCFWAYGYANEQVRRRQSEGYREWTETLAMLIARSRSLEISETRHAGVELAALVDGLTIQLMLRPDELAPSMVTKILRERLERLP